MLDILTVNEVEVAEVRRRYARRILRETRFQAGCQLVRESYLVSLVAMPPLGESRYEFLVSDAPVTYGRKDDSFEIAQAGDYVLLRLEMPAEGGKSLQEAVYAAYKAVFAEVRARNMSLLRVWHYIPAILDWVDSGRPIHLFLTLHNTESVDYIDGPLTAGGPTLSRSPMTR